MFVECVAILVALFVRYFVRLLHEGSPFLQLWYVGGTVPFIGVVGGMYL